MHSSGDDSGREQAGMSQRHQIDQAQSAFLTAYVVAIRNLPLNGEIDDARLAMQSAQKDYQKTTADAEAELAARSDIRGMRQTIDQLERRLDAVDPKDMQGRYDLADQLMEARSRLSAIERDTLSTDADITVAKAAYLQAASTLGGLQQRQQAMVFQDASVLAAKQRLIELRHQLAYGQ